MSIIESVLQESRLFAAPADFVKQAHVSGMPAYQALCAESERDYEGFWARLARENLLWHKPFSSVLDETKAPFIKWFGNGELNVSYNCLDRYLNSQPNKVAILKEIALKPAIDEALAMGGCEAVRNVVVYKRTGGAMKMESQRDLWWHDVLQNQPDACEPVWVNAEQPPFILYTSGSTGKPKGGRQHSSAGYLPPTILSR